MAKELKKYIEQYKPKQWLFDATNPINHCSTSILQKAFNTAVKKSGIKKHVSLKNLKYSYVKHLVNQGVPLGAILQDLGLLNDRTVYTYSRLGLEDFSVDFSPLDKIVYGDSPGNIDTRPLERRLFSVDNEDERDYLLESINCIKAGVNRAGVVFAWTAAMENIYNRCIKHSSVTLNATLRKHWSNAPTIKRIEDLVRINDNTILLACVDLGEFDKNQKDILAECLNLIIRDARAERAQNSSSIISMQSERPLCTLMG